MKAKSPATAAPADQLRENEKKWTKPLMAAGWTVLPDVIIQRQKALGLDPLDVNIILHLASRWWRADGKPFPSKKSIAAATGVHPRTIQKRIASLEAGGFIRRQQRRMKGGRGSDTNIYHLDGLISAATPYAEEIINARAADKARREKAAAKKGRPKLKVVSGGDDD